MLIPVIFSGVLVVEGGAAFATLNGYCAFAVNWVPSAITGTGAVPQSRPAESSRGA